MFAAPWTTNMSDLVERLRWWSSVECSQRFPAGIPSGLIQLSKEAADHIERLEQAVKDSVAMIKTRDEKIAEIDAWSNKLANYIIKLACQYAELEEALSKLEDEKSTRP